MALRKGRKKSAAKTVTTVAIIKPEGKKMAKKKKKVQKNGKVRRAISKVRSYAKTDAVSVVKNAAIAAGGGIAAGMLANKLPIANPKLKAIIPIVAGVALATTIGRKKHMFHELGTGMVVLGVVALVRQLAPTVPMLAGEDDGEQLLGFMDDQGQQELSYGGEPMQIGDDDEFSSMGENVSIGDGEYVSAADDD